MNPTSSQTTNRYGFTVAETAETMAEKVRQGTVTNLEARNFMGITEDAVLAPTAEQAIRTLNRRIRDARKAGGDYAEETIAQHQATIARIRAGR